MRYERYLGTQVEWPRLRERRDLKVTLEVARFEVDIKLVRLFYKPLAEEVLHRETTVLLHES
jgi:hypothetical protein